MDGCHVNYSITTEYNYRQPESEPFFFNSPHNPIMVSIFNLRRAVACGLDATPIRRLWTFRHWFCHWEEPWMQPALIVCSR